MIACLNGCDGICPFALQFRGVDAGQPDLFAGVGGTGIAVATGCDDGSGTNVSAYILGCVLSCLPGSSADASLTDQIQTLAPPPKA